MSQPSPDPAPTLSMSSPAKEAPAIRAGGDGLSTGEFAIATDGVPVAVPRPRGPGGEEPRYRTLRPLGQGGLGVVRVALDEELNREVALKEIQERHLGTATVDRFLLEAEITGRLEHPGVVPVYGLGMYADGRPYYAMRLIRGESFKAGITSFHAADKPGRDPGERSLALRGLLRRFTDVCNAVGYAHSKGVLHRDLKPDNVMLGPFGETLVVDWGLAKLLGQVQQLEAESGVLLPAGGSGSSAQTQEGAVVGTPQYMSPEQALAKNRELTPATDIYALGAILYTVLTGQPPFDKAPSVIALLSQVIGGEFPPPGTVKRGVPPALEAVCLKAMANDPAARYGSAKELAADVDHWLADEPVTAFREPVTARVRRWGRRHRALVSSAAVLLVTLTAALAVGLGLVDAERARTAAARDRERDAKEAEQEANANLAAAYDREKSLKEAEQKTNTALMASLDREKTLKALAVKSEQNAYEQRQIAVDTATDVIFVLDERLKNYPAMKQVRKELIERAKQGLQKVARAADTAAKIDQRTVWIHIKLGEIAQRIEGNRQVAKTEYEMAFQLAKRVADADPTSRNAQHDLWACLINIGDMQEAQGDLKGAMTSYQDGLKITRTLAAADPSDAIAQRDLAYSLYRIGGVQEAQGDLKGAMTSYQEGLKINGKLADAAPASLTAQRDLSQSYERMGNLRSREGDSKAALTWYQQMHEVKKRLVAAEPTSVTAQRDLSISFTDIGKAQQAQGDLKGALASYQEGLKIKRKLADDDRTNFQAQIDLLVSYQRLGNTEKELLNFKSAREWFSEGRDVALRLHREGKLAGSFKNAVADMERARAFCDKIDPSVTDLDFALKQPKAEVPELLDKRLRVLAQKGDLAGCVATAEACEKRADNNPIALYEACYLWSLCAGLAKDDLAQADKYAVRAVALLKQAITRGNRDLAHMRVDPDLDPLREREDFKTVLKGLEPKKPEKPK